MAASAPTKKAPAKPSPDETLSVEEIIARMDRALPGWKKYVEDRKAGKPKAERRNEKEYKTFERLYGVLRKRGSTLAAARKEVNKN